MQNLLVMGVSFMLLSACFSPRSSKRMNQFFDPSARSIADTQSDMNFDLNQYQWQNRILLVFAPSEQSPAYQQQRQDWRSQTQAMQDRDLKQVELLATGISRVNGQPITEQSAERLRKQFDVSSETFAVVLIGKDGTEKRRFSEPVASTELFNTIDAMPMRQQEMRDRSNQ
ncbi:MAG TPA: DUF4174 domain-containing protein [Leptolyngbya sp.]|nr:DUF4174 domain-containing protein [Leptolyngbya sp.]